MWARRFEARFGLPTSFEGRLRTERPEAIPPPDRGFSADDRSTLRGRFGVVSKRIGSVISSRVSGHHFAQKVQTTVRGVLLELRPDVEATWAHFRRLPESGMSRVGVGGEPLDLAADRGVLSGVSGE